MNNAYRAGILCMLLFCTTYLNCISTLSLKQSATLHHPPSFDSLRHHVAFHPIKRGSGTILLSVNGEKKKGEVDILQQAETASVTFYSLIGGIIGTIRIVEDSGEIAFLGKTVRLSLDQSVDTLGLLWCSNVSLEELFAILTGNIPATVSRSLFMPETTIATKSESISSFFLKSQRLKMHFSTRTGKLKRIILDYSFKEKPFSIEYSSYQQGVPYMIMLKFDENNFLKLKYAVLTTHRMD